MTGDAGRGMAGDEATSIASIKDREGQMNDLEAVPTGKGSAVAAEAKERRGHVMTIRGIRMGGARDDGKE